MTGSYAVRHAVIVAALLATSAVKAEPQTFVMFTPGPTDNDAMMTYYPPAAKAAGVEGEATLSCARQEHGAPRDCTLASENPPRAGFGTAALALASLAHENPKIATTAAAGPVRFVFKLNPPSITPVVLGTPHEWSLPHWIHKPTGDDVVRVCRHQCRFKPASVLATLRCVVTVSGLLTDCTAVSEIGGANFQEAALKLAPLFEMNPPTEDGEPHGGAAVTFRSGSLPGLNEPGAKWRR